MRPSPLLALIGLVLGGCATTPPQLVPYPGVGKRIIAYYDGQSATDNPTCTQGPAYTPSL